MARTSTSSKRTATTRTGVTVDCPHCKKPFVAKVDLSQPPRLQSAPCPHCRLRVPQHAIARSMQAREAAAQEA